MIELKKQLYKKIIILVMTISFVIIACFATSCQSPLDKSNPETMTLDEAKRVINRFYLSTVNSIELIDREKYFGEEILCYAGIENDIIFSILASDRSLVSFGTKEVDTEIPIELSDDKLQQIALDYVEKIWDFNNIQIIEYEVQQLGEYSFFNVEGVMGESKRYFRVNLNGKGKLVSITSYPNDIDIKKGVSQDTAREESIESIKKWLPFCDSDKLVLVSEGLSKDPQESQFSFPIYYFKYEYRQDNPTPTRFDFDCDILINVATGKNISLGITPIVDNIDVIQIDKAEELAKKHIAEKIGKDISKFKIKESFIDAYTGQLKYHFVFHYAEDSNRYSVMMSLSNNKFSLIDIEPGNN